MSAIEDEILFGWDPTPGIVSVWADSEGQALVWRRIDGEIHCERERFHPWLLATTLADLDHLGAKLGAVRSSRPAPGRAGPPPVSPVPPIPPMVRYRELDGDTGSYRYLLAARSGRALVKAIVSGASRRLGRRIHGLSELDGYYRVGPVEQYLMQTGRVYFRGLHYDDLHRLQVDLETTALDPQTGRIFLAAVRDTQGLAVTLEASTPAEEPRLIESLCALVRERDPDVIENHNLFGFDLPFLEHPRRGAWRAAPARPTRRPRAPRTPEGRRRRSRPCPPPPLQPRRARAHRHARRGPPA